MGFYSDDLLTIRYVTKCDGAGGVNDYKIGELLSDFDDCRLYLRQFREEGLKDLLMRLAQLQAYVVDTWNELEAEKRRPVELGIQVVNNFEDDSVTIQPGDDQLIIVERDKNGEVRITIQDGECAEERIVLGKKGSTLKV